MRSYLLSGLSLIVWILPILMRPTHCNVSFHCDCKSHVNRSTKWDCWHWVKNIDVEFWQDCRGGKQLMDQSESSIGMDRNVGYDVSVKVSISAFYQFQNIYPTFKSSNIVFKYFYLINFAFGAFQFTNGVKIQFLLL